MRRSLYQLILLLGMLLAFSPAATFAQASCPAIVSAAFTEARAACAGALPNTLCYGSGSLTATFSSPQNFAAPGDTVPLESVNSLRSLGYDAANGSYSVAIIQAAYNLPLAYPGDFNGIDQALVLVQGDVLLESQVNRDNLAILGVGTPVTVAQTTDLLRFPPNFSSEVSRVVGLAPEGQTYIADAITRDRSFVRVGFVFQEVGENSRRAAAWLSADALARFDESALTPVDGETVNALQRFDFTYGAPVAGACAEAVNQVGVSGPIAIETQFRINNARVTVASDVILDKSTAADGSVTVEWLAANGSTSVIVPPITTPFTVSSGNALTTLFDSNGNPIAAPAVRTLSADEAATLERFRMNVGFLRGLE